MSGTWNGTWTDDQSGTQNSLTFTLRQQGSVLDGSIAIDGTACLSGGVVQGEAHGHFLRFTVVGREVRMTFNGSFSGTTMNGTYTTTCEAPTGTWNATKG
jgi:hypothetical protein